MPHGGPEWRPQAEVRLDREQTAGRREVRKIAEGMRRRGGRRGARLSSQRGFTLVELLMVVIISLILVAGLIGLVNMSVNMFDTNRNLQAITDTGRMVMSSIVRQLQGALMLGAGSPDCTRTKITFWADILGDYPNPESSDDALSPYYYANAPKIAFYLSGDNVVQDMTKPETGSPTVSTRIGSYVTALNFYYYPYASVPNWNASPNGIESDTRQIDVTAPSPKINKNTGLVAIELVMKKGTVTRTFRQDVTIRTFNTEGLDEE